MNRLDRDRCRRNWAELDKILCATVAGGMFALFAIGCLDGDPKAWFSDFVLGFSWNFLWRSLAVNKAR